VASESRHISTSIKRPATEVYDYAANPANLPEWAAGLGGSIERVDGQWVADSPMGRVVKAYRNSSELLMEIPHLVERATSAVLAWRIGRGVTGEGLRSPQIA